MTPRRLAERDGWACWLCGADVDPAAATGSPHAGSVDHVVPRARGGGSEPENLRLAHRQCNSRRGSAVPELDWPRDVPVVDHTDVWSVVRRALRRPGEWEVVGVVVGEDGGVLAERWLTATVPLVLGGAWDVRRSPLGEGLSCLALRRTPTQGPRPARTPGRVRRRQRAR